MLTSAPLPNRGCFAVNEVLGLPSAEAAALIAAGVCADLGHPVDPALPVVGTTTVVLDGVATPVTTSTTRPTPIDQVAFRANN